MYHTNVMMSIGNELAVVCLDAITDEQERKNVEVSSNSNVYLFKLITRTICKNTGEY